MIPPLFFKYNNKNGIEFKGVQCINITKEGSKGNLGSP